MIGLRAGLSIWIATQPVDFRRGMDSLAMLVSEAFGADPFDGGLYVFRSKRRDRVKILTWDGSGLVSFTTKESRGSSPGRRSRKASCRYLMLSSRCCSMARTGSVCRCDLWISRYELVDHYQEAFVTHAELL
ncbi:hypothetical protein ABIF27_008975 [Bradyrhizobium elkanii]